MYGLRFTVLRFFAHYQDVGARSGSPIMIKIEVQICSLRVFKPTRVLGNKFQWQGEFLSQSKYPFKFRKFSTIACI